MFRSSRNIKEEVRALIASQLKALDSERVNAALEEIQAEQLRSEVKQLRLERVRPTVQHILANEVNSDVAINTANLDLIAGDMLGNDRAFTVQGVCDSINALGSKLGRKPAPTEAEQRQALEAALTAEGASSTLIAKFPGMTIAQLQTKLEELRNVKKWKSMDHNQLKQEVRATTQAHGFEPIPDNLSAYNISQMSGAEWATALRKYGQAQLDARIAAQQAAGDWKHTPIVGGVK